jgi:hypothetical protein
MSQGKGKFDQGMKALFSVPEDAVVKAEKKEGEEAFFPRRGCT